MYGLVYKNLGNVYRRKERLTVIFCIINLSAFANVLLFGNKAPDFLQVCKSPFPPQISSHPPLTPSQAVLISFVSAVITLPFGIAMPQLFKRIMPSYLARERELQQVTVASPSSPSPSPSGLGASSSDFNIRSDY